MISFFDFSPPPMFTLVWKKNFPDAINNLVYTYSLTCLAGIKSDMIYCATHTVHGMYVGHFIPIQTNHSCVK